MAEYVKAVRAAGLGVGLYYSPLDWRFPGFFFPGIYQASADQLRAQYQRQVDELASNYGKIDLIWFDGGGDEWLGFGGLEFNGEWKTRPKDQPYRGIFDWHDTDTVAHLRQLQPDILVNDRTNAHADFRSLEGDGALGDFQNGYPWELCTTITEGAWGYQPDAKVKPLSKLIHLLVGAAGRDGNFLLNVGPTPDGEIPSSQADRVREIGQWLQHNGVSIYGTRGGPWLPGSYGVSTHSGPTIYLHLFDVAKDGLVSLPQLPVKVVSVSVLNGSSVQFKQSGHELIVNVPATVVNAIDTILKVMIDRPWITSAVVPVPSAK